MAYSYFVLSQTVWRDRIVNMSEDLVRTSTYGAVFNPVPLGWQSITLIAIHHRLSRGVKIIWKFLV